jgi:hypothetical protein
MKVVINRCFGGFSLSKEALQWLKEKGLEIYKYSDGRGDRCNPLVVECVETLGKRADGACAKLKVVDIPFSGLEGWEIDDYDGMEKIVQTHQSWS